MRAITRKVSLSAGFLAALTFFSGCGSNSATPAVKSAPVVTSNVQAISVNTGPSSVLGSNFNYVNGAFTSVTVCVPGSTTECQTIGGILVDTGSFGLRILSSALTVPLPQQNDGGGNPVAECAAFADGITWGPVQTADVQIAGEKAGSLPIQVIGSASFPTIPGNCTSQGVPEDDLQSLGANGLLGIGQAIQDCGNSCTANGSTGAYYSCPSSGCTDASESLAKQVQNPVAAFATDNNGVIVELPAVAGAQATVSGSLIFGIGTQSNNGLGGATVFGTDAFGDLTTAYKSVIYPSFLDSGSNAIYFLDAATTGLPACSDLTFLYCPSATQSISIVNNAQPGTNGASQAATFSVGSADVLLTNVNNAAANGLAGPSSGQVDLGLPFFFGRSVFTAIDGRSTPGGTGPYTAY